MMGLGMELKRLVNGECGNSKCLEQILQTAREIIEVLTILFPQSVIRSYFCFPQLYSWMTFNGTVYKCRIIVDSKCVDVQLKNFEISGSPSLVNCKAVKWKKSGAFMHFSSHFEFAGRKNEEEKPESEVLKVSLAAFDTFCKRIVVHRIQLLIDDGDAWKLPYLLSSPQIYQFCSLQKCVKETFKFTVVENLLSAADSSTPALLPRQALPPSRTSRRETLPRRTLIASVFRFMSTTSKAFSKTTGLPLNSSPAPLNRNESNFVLDQSVKSTRNSTVKKTAREETRAHILLRRNTSSSSGLLCNFEESALNGRLNLVATMDGFYLEIAASDEVCTPHITLPVTTFFFNMPEDEAPLPCIGFCSLGSMRRGYRIPRKGILQAVLFNPQGTVVRMFVVRFDVNDMPPSSQTFLRQRTFFMPIGCSYDGVLRSWLKYSIHISLATDRRGRVYVHTDIKMLFSQKNELETLNFELGKEVIKYQLQSFTEMPRNPKYSPRK